MKKKYVHQILACFPALYCQFLLGIGWGWVPPTLMKLRGANAEFKVTEEDVSWLASINEVGRMLGPSVSPLLLDNLGRKRTLLLVSIIYFSVWATVIFVKDIYVVLATRLVFGLGNGINDVANPVYTTEICSPKLRGIVGSGVQIAFNVGFTFELLVATYLSYTNAAIVNTVLGVIAICLQYFTLETAYFLTLKGQDERARRNFSWLQVDHPDIEDELRKIRKNVEEEKQKKESLRTLFASKTNLKSILVVAGFGLLSSAVGFHTIMPYSAMIFKSSKTSILFGVVQFAGTITSLFVIERINRRPLLIYSFVIITCCNICTAALMFFHGRHYDIVFYEELLFSLIALYAFVGSVLSPASYSIVGEIPPLSVRAIASSTNITASSIASFVTAFLFLPITERFGMETNFSFYIVTSVMVTVFIHVVVPETRGKALYEMHEKRVVVETEPMMPRKIEEHFH